MTDPIQDLPGEIWKPVVGWEGCYSVSNKGRVAVDAHRVKHWRGGWRMKRAKIIGWVAGNGRPGVFLYYDGDRVNRAIHRLVLEAFVGPCPEGLCCCHNDGNPANNTLENLRWDTYQSNSRDRLLHGTGVVGTDNPRAKMTESDVRTARAAWAGGASAASLARVYNVGGTTMSMLLHRQTWAHVS